MEEEFEMISLHYENNIHTFIFRKQGELSWKWIEIDSLLIIGILKKLMENNITEDIRKIIFEKIKRNFDTINSEIIDYEHEHEINSDTEYTEYEWNSEEYPHTD